MKVSNRIKDIIGQKFGNLTVLYREEDYISPKNKKTIARWLSKCSCGNHRISYTYELNKGHHTDCGHCNKDSKKVLGTHQIRYNNEYILTGSHGICIIRPGIEFIFSLESYNKIKEYKWKVHPGGQYIITGNKINSKHKIYYLHRILMDVTDRNIQIDHINNNPRDNRLENLRTCTSSENRRNIRIGKYNTSGVVGVYYMSRENKWGATISMNGKNITLGSFDNFDEAVRVRKQAEIDYYGDFRYRPEMDYRNKKVEVI